MRKLKYKIVERTYAKGPKDYRAYYKKGLFWKRIKHNRDEWNDEIYWSLEDAIAAVNKIALKFCKSSKIIIEGTL